MKDSSNSSAEFFQNFIMIKNSDALETVEFDAFFIGSESEIDVPTDSNKKIFTKIYKNEKY